MIAWDCTETKKPHGWTLKLARAFPLHDCTRVKIEHRDTDHREYISMICDREPASSKETSVCSDRCWSKEHIPHVNMEVTGTLVLLSRVAELESESPEVGIWNSYGVGVGKKCPTPKKYKCICALYLGKTNFKYQLTGFAILAPGLLRCHLYIIYVF